MMRRWAGLGLAGLAVLAGACGSGARDGNGGQETMSDARAKATDLLRLPDDDYPDLDEDKLAELQERLRVALSTSEGGKSRPLLTEFLGVGAPRRVNLDAMKEIPILVGIRYPGRRAWEVNLEVNGILVAVDLASGTLHSGWPFLLDKRKPPPVPSRSGPAPEGIKGSALTTGVKRVDLRRAVEAELKPSRLALTVLSHDWVSNTSVIELWRRDEAAAEAVPRAATPGLTRTTAGPGIPKLEGSGAALAMPKDVDPGDPVTIGVAVNLPSAEAVVVPSSAPGGGSLLVATVLLRKLDETLPVKIELAVPAEVSGGAKGGTVRAHFEFDALRHVTGDRLSGEYLAYLVTGTRVFGPHALKVGVR